jgi:HK97 family phage portal protein
VGFTSDVRASLKRVDQGSTSITPYFTLSQDSSTRRIAIQKSGALLSNAYLTAEQAKCRAFGGLPGHVFRDGDRGRERVKNHPVQAFVSGRWNPIMTSQTGRQWLSVRRDTFGTAYVRVEWYKGEPVRYWPIEATVETFFDPTLVISPVRYRVGAGDMFTPPGTYLDREILVCPTCISTDGGVTGRSLAELAASEIGLSIDLTRFYANIVQKGFSPGGYLEHEKKLDEDDVRAIAKKNQILSGPEHAGEVRIFDQGLKYHAITGNMVEADIVKQEEFILQGVARAVYVQPNKVFDFSRATYSNIEAAGIAFVTDTMTNEVTAIEAEVNKLFAVMGQPDNYVKWDLRGLQRGDFKGQMEGFVAGIYGGVYGRDEVREYLELPYREGTEEMLQPAAYYTVDPQTGEAKPLPPKASGLVASLSSPLDPIVADARARIAARAEKDGDCPKTRDFAFTVLKPVRDAYALAGLQFDIDHEIEGVLQHAEA